MGGKKLCGLFDRHREHISDGLTVVLYFQGLAVKAGSAAILTGHVGSGQEVHLQLDDTLALTGIAAPALIIE